jgi:hypothetical protein
VLAAPRQPGARRARGAGRAHAPRRQTHGRHSHIGACALAPRPRARPAMAAPRGPTPPPRAAPTPRPRAPSFARVLRRPWELGQETWETPALCSPCAVWPGSVRGTINTNPLTSIRPSSEKRWSGGARRARRDPPPGPGPGATRDRHYNGTGLQPPPPRPAAPRAAGRPYTEPGCVVRRYHGTFYSILRGLGFFAGLPSGGSWTRAPDAHGGSCIV